VRNVGVHPPGHSATIGIDCAACTLKETSSLLDKQTYPSDLLKSEGVLSSPAGERVAPRRDIVVVVIVSIAKMRDNAGLC